MCTFMKIRRKQRILLILCWVFIAGSIIVPILFGNSKNLIAAYVAMGLILISMILYRCLLSVAQKAIRLPAPNHKFIYSKSQKEISYMSGVLLNNRHRYNGFLIATGIWISMLIFSKVYEDYDIASPETWVILVLMAIVAFSAMGLIYGKPEEVDEEFMDKFETDKFNGGYK